MTATTAAATKATIEESGHESDGSLTWEDFFGSTTAEDLVPTLLSMYDRLVGRGGPGGQSGGCRSGGDGGQQQASQLTRPPEPPPPPPPPTSVSAAAGLLASPRPLSQTSISSSSSSSSSGGGTLCKRQAFLASIESLEDSGEEEDRGRPARGGGSSRSSPPSKAGSQGSEDSGVYSPRSCVSSPGGSTTAEERGGGGQLGAGGRLQGGPPPSDLQLSYTDRVVLEIVETEQVYVHHLSQVIHGYIEQLETSSNCPISKSDLHDLFGNIRQIYTFNSTFLRELEDCGMDPVRVAQVFVRNNCGFSVYTHYCTNYPRAVGVLTSLMRDERVVRLFRERQASLGHTLPLGSYLLKPVQRILKYHLLLQNIVKNGSEREAGYYDLVTALSTMTGIAQHINDMKRKHEHAVRVQEIQSLLIGWQGEDLTRYGELCAEGTFRMAGAKALRHAFLFDQILLITKKKEEGILQYKAHIMCSNLMLIESIPGEPLCFHVIPFDNPRHQYTLQARSLEQKREWSLQLKRVILENYNAVIPSHARQLVMELGQTRTDEELLSERGGGQSRGRQHSAPEYLERRKQEQRRKSSTEGGVFRCRLQRASRVRKSDLSPSHLKEKLRLRRSVASRGDDSLRTSTESKLDSCGSEEGCVGSPLRSGTPGGEERSATPCESPATSRRPLPPPPEEEGANSPLTDRRLQSNPATPLPETLAPVEPPARCPENGHGVAEPQSTPTKAEEKKKTIEEIVSQLLMQNKEFQRVLKKQRHITSRRCRAETSEDDDDDEDEDEGLSPSVTGSSVSSLNSNSARRVLPSGLLVSRCPQDPDYDNLWSTAAAEIKRTRSFTGGGGEREGSSPEISLSGSRDSFGGPTCPAVWLKQQHQHLVVTVASTKAGSLPRGFQLGGGGPPSGSATSDCWARHRVSPDRPFTIASDKAAELNLEEMERYCEEAGSGAALLLQRQRFPLPPDETEDESTPDQSTSDLLHPEHRVYRPSLTRATIKQVISSVSQKLGGLRAASSSNETLDQSGSVELGGPGAEGRGGGRLRQAFSRTFRHSGRAAEEEKTEVARRLVAVGSRTVGARMANVSSDYADPRTLFPTITRSRKAASLLGIRPYSADLPSSASSSSGYTGSCSSSQLRTEENGESDGSTDSFYERSFDAIESTLSEACRDSAVFSESEELTPSTAESGLRTAAGEEQGGGGSPRKRKVPPPVPDKPPSLLRLPRSASELASRCSSEFGRSPSEFCVRSLSELSPRQPPATAPSTPGDEDYDSSSVASTVIESSSCTSLVSSKGWVKQVVCKIQGDPLL